MTRNNGRNQPETITYILINNRWYDICNLFLSAKMTANCSPPPINQDIGMNETVKKCEYKCMSTENYILEPAYLNLV